MSRSLLTDVPHYPNRSFLVCQHVSNNQFGFRSQLVCQQDRCPVSSNRESLRAFHVLLPIEVRTHNFDLQCNGGGTRENLHGHGRLPIPGLNLGVGHAIKTGIPGDIVGRNNKLVQTSLRYNRFNNLSMWRASSLYSGGLRASLEGFSVKGRAHTIDEHDAPSRGQYQRTESIVYCE